MGTANPFRYRGYYYDNESGFYYLQSRYYDPVTGRFLNQDIYVNSGKYFTGYNMFTYCLNNPVNRIEIEGKLSVKNDYIPHPKNTNYYWKKVYTDVIVSWNDYRSFVWTLERNGNMHFSNITNNLGKLENVSGGILMLAKGMLSISRRLVKDSLRGRTENGIAAELILHYAFYKMGLITNHTDVADMGSLWGEAWDWDAYIPETIAIQNEILRLGLKRYKEISRKYKLIMPLIRWVR